MSVALSTGTDRSYRQRLAALSLAMLLPSLGTSIANVALPTLAVSFDAPFADVQWVVISYLLAVTTLIVGAGRLGDMLGKRRMLLAGIAIFAVASAGGMIATNLWVLVAARALQGAGAAFMMALTVAAVGDMVPKERTGSAMGLLGTVSAAGTALGPTLGGALISWFGWAAVFAFMTGAAVLALVFAHQVLPGRRRRLSGRNSRSMSRAWRCSQSRLAPVRWRPRLAARHPASPSPCLPPCPCWGSSCSS
jgi:MFS family permease